MNFCTNCGARLNQSGPCPECGQPPPNNSYSQNVNAYQGPVDNGSAGWGLLGFCVPLVGLILYLVWKDTQPLNAKSAGTGALISVIISIFLYFFIIVLALAI